MTKHNHSRKCGSLGKNLGKTERKKLGKTERKSLGKTERKNLGKTERKNLGKTERKIIIPEENGCSKAKSAKQKVSTKPKHSNKAGASKSSNTVLVPMNAKEVHKTTQAIKAYSSKLQLIITQLALVIGWVILGYSSFKEYVEGELYDCLIGYDALNRHRRIGECIYALAGMQYVGYYKGDAIMLLVKFDLPKQKQIWKQLINQHGEADIPPSWLNKKRVRHAIGQLGYAASKDAVEVSSVDTNKAVVSEQTINVDNNDKRDGNGDIDALANTYVDVDADSDQMVELLEEPPVINTASERPSGKGEARFYECLEKTYVDDPIFSRRVLKSIKGSLQKNNILLICKYLLVNQDEEEVREVVKYLKAHFK